MDRESIIKISEFIIRWSFILLFFLVPLFFTPYNYELFEYNKMMLTYGLTAIIVSSFFIKSIILGRIEIQRTPFDIPVIIFFLSQVLSTIFSIDRHTSLFGYYSRFHGGLLSTISYIALYYVLVWEFKNAKNFVLTLLYSSLISGVLVSIYAILQRLGIDKHIWVQDVQNRVFSTLGQPNWLAAYISILIIFSIAFFLKNSSQKKYLFLFLAVLFYLVLIYTKSRSGFLGFWVGFLTLAVLVFQSASWRTKNSLLTSVIFLILASFLFGTPFSELQKYTFEGIKGKFTQPQQSSLDVQPEISQPVLETGGTESGSIRRIVWKGAIDVFKHYPILGSGVETFAYSYYQYRPKEHNLTSEWDFLYNKAHNEYLNFAATTGTVGLGSYILLIFAYSFWVFKTIKNKSFDYLTGGLFGAYISILVSNFFGFSVVIIGIFFFLVPAFSFILSQNPKEESSVTVNLFSSQKIVPGLLFFVTCYLLYVLLQMWRADYYYNLGLQLYRSENPSSAYQATTKAIKLNSSEPLYKDSLSQISTSLSIAAYLEKDEQLSIKLKNESLNLSYNLVTNHPRNLNYWKTRTRVLYSLSEIDESLFAQAIPAILKTWSLAPNDPKIAYNVGLLYAKAGENDKAIETLIQATELKPDYYEPYFALALFYEQLGENDKAIEKLEYILKNIRPEDQQSKDKLNELNK